MFIKCTTNDDLIFGAEHSVGQGPDNEVALALFISE